MLKRIYRILILLFIGSPCVFGASAKPIIDTATVSYPLYFQLPNNQWHLAVNQSPNKFIFKRNEILDSKGNRIVPAIMIYAENVKAYNGNLAMFTSKKIQPFTDDGVKDLKFMIYTDKGYPLNIKNAIFVKGAYTDSGLDHIIYMIYIFDQHDRGIQVYMDMTKELEAKYGQEFMTTIKSLKELK